MLYISKANTTAQLYYFTFKSKKKSNTIHFHLNHILMWTVTFSEYHSNSIEPVILSSKSSYYFIIAIVAIKHLSFYINTYLIHFLCYIHITIAIYIYICYRSYFFLHLYRIVRIFVCNSTSRKTAKSDMVILFLLVTCRETNFNRI